MLFHGILDLSLPLQVPLHFVSSLLLSLSLHFSLQPLQLLPVLPASVLKAQLLLDLSNQESPLLLPHGTLTLIPGCLSLVDLGDDGLGSNCSLHGQLVALDVLPSLLGMTIVYILVFVACRQSNPTLFRELSWE